MREARGPASVLPSIPMLVFTVAVLAFGLPRAWAAVAAMQPQNLESQPEAIAGQSAAADTTHAGPGE
jgi:hypothetical protein